MKFWLCGVTQNREKDIDEMTKDTYQLFDGIVAVVNQPSNDSTFDILESRKGQGKIITRGFVPHHAHLMNEFLFAGVIQNNDYFLILDSSDRISPRWIKTIRQDVETWAKNDVAGVFLDRIYLARYNELMEFYGGVHWGLQPILGKIVNISQIPGYQKSSWIINTRQNNPNISGIEHPIKYFVQYPNDSQVRLLYGQFGREVYEKHTLERLAFRIFVQEKLNIPCTVESLVAYLTEGIKSKTLPTYIIDYIQLEVNMQDLVRYYILKQDFLTEICLNRFNWDFKKFYYEGVGHQNKNDGYVGVFNKYKIAKGEKSE